MDNKKLADLIFPHINKTVEDYEKMYPSRGEGHITSRFSPSPTGFMHIGGLYTSIVAQKFVEQHNGTFILRIEDTDTARTMDGAIDIIIDNMKRLGITINEGPLGPNHHDIGDYGPYIQSKRIDIYHAFIKWLVAEGKAYPCWMTADEMDAVRVEQKALKKAPGIYGNYSFWRNKTPEEYAEQLEKYPEGYVIRFRSPGDASKRVVFDDINRAKISMPENINDMVMMKSSDKLPTYHLAHAVDDHLMRTTHVIRSDEWLTSVPLHLQLFEAFGNKAPTYCHVAPILKLDDGKKRKLSKRKDPEAASDYYFKEGYSKQGIIDYLLALVDSRYEEWMEANPDKDHNEFEIKLEDMNTSGALLDVDKLNHVNNNYLSKISNEHLYGETLEWAEAYRKDLAELMDSNSDYAIAALGIERHTEKDPKRFTTYIDVENQIRFFFDSEYEIMKKTKPDFPLTTEPHVMLIFVSEYEEIIDFTMDTMEWFTHLKELAKKYGFAPNNREFREGNYQGKIGEIAMFMRIQLACATRTPDLYSMMKVMGKERVFKRLKDGLS